MIEKFAIINGKGPSEFLDLNHTSKSMFLVSLMIPKFAPGASRELRRTSESGHLRRTSSNFGKPKLGEMQRTGAAANPKMPLSSPSARTTAARLAPIRTTISR
jgi:hypothetical protein